MSFLHWRERWALTFHMALKQRLTDRLIARSPLAYRNELHLTPRASDRFADLIQPWQQTDFAAMDAAWLQLAGKKSSPPYLRAWLERPRGHSKTSDMAAQIAWILLYSKRCLSGIAAAADRDQAALIGAALEQLARSNPRLCAPLKFQKHAVINPQTGSRLEMISSDVQSSWGALPDFVVCDELCHWEKPDLWHSLLSSAAKKPDCVLTVLTNAGVGRGWQWEVRESARTSSSWYFSSLDGPQAPWLSPESLQEQEALLPRPVFERLWLNRWQHSDGEFVTLAEAEACRDDSLTVQQHGDRRRKYFAAIDYAEKHDYTVGVVLHAEEHRLIVDRMDVTCPKPNVPVRVAWVENWMQIIARNFPGVTFIIDEYQLLSLIQQYETRYPIQRFEFLAGRGNHALALNLRRLLIHREIAWYPGCGRLPDTDTRDDLETELSSLILRQTASGRCRIDHLPDTLHHDDRAFALGAAALYATQQTHSPSDTYFEITPPTQTGGFNW